MSERECEHFSDSIVYELEKTAIYCGVMGAQLFSRLNIGVTLDQFIALDAISFNENICQRDLSKIILKDRSNTGRILNILEEGGFIERKIETKKNRLVKKIYITQKGLSIIKDNQERLRNTFEGVFEDISDEEFAILRGLLCKMRSGLSKMASLQI